MDEPNTFFLCLRCGEVHEQTGVSVRYPQVDYPHKDRCSVCDRQDMGYTYIHKSDAIRLPKKGGRKRGRLL